MVRVPSSANAPWRDDAGWKKAFPSQTFYSVFSSSADRPFLQEMTCQSRQEWQTKPKGHWLRGGCCLTRGRGVGGHGQVATGKGTWRQEKQAQGVWGRDHKDFMGCCTCKFSRGTQRGNRVGNVYKKMFIESVLQTDNMKGFWGLWAPSECRVVIASCHWNLSHRKILA